MARLKGSPKTSGSGRKKGTPNKSTRTLREAFQKHGEVLVERLLELTEDDDPSVRLGALKACFDRGWGRPPQPLTDATLEGPAIVEIERRVVPAKPNGADPSQPLQRATIVQ